MESADGLRTPLDRVVRSSATPSILRVRRLLAPTRFAGSRDPAQLSGPYILSGGWWQGNEVHREYHYARTRGGDLLWIYYDRRRKRWVLQGRVE